MRRSQQVVRTHRQRERPGGDILADHRHLKKIATWLWWLLCSVRLGDIVSFPAESVRIRIQGTAKGRLSHLRFANGHCCATGLAVADVTKIGFIF
jgi:hypothetical protein